MGAFGQSGFASSRDSYGDGVRKLLPSARPQRSSAPRMQAYMQPQAAPQAAPQQAPQAAPQQSAPMAPQPAVQPPAVQQPAVQPPASQPPPGWKDPYEALNRSVMGSKYDPYEMWKASQQIIRLPSDPSMPQ